MRHLRHLRHLCLAFQLAGCVCAVKVQGVGCRVQGVGCRVQGVGCRAFQPTVHTFPYTGIHTLIWGCAPKYRHTRPYMGIHALIRAYTPVYGDALPNIGIHALTWAYTPLYRDTLLYYTLWRTPNWAVRPTSNKRSFSSSPMRCSPYCSTSS